MDSNNGEIVDRKKCAIIFATFIFSMALVVVIILAVASPIIIDPESPYIIIPELTTQSSNLTTNSTEKSYRSENVTFPIGAQTNGSDLAVKSTIEYYSISTATTPGIQTKFLELVLNITARTHDRFVTTIPKEPQTKGPDLTNKTDPITDSM